MIKPLGSRVLATREPFVVLRRTVAEPRSRGFGLVRPAVYGGSGRAPIEKFRASFTRLPVGRLQHVEEFARLKPKE